MVFVSLLKFLINIKGVYNVYTYLWTMEEHTGYHFGEAMFHIFKLLDWNLWNILDDNIMESYFKSFLSKEDNKILD